jgi:hypothetical protein
MTKPIITQFSQITALLVHKYERYLPTAFDESLSLLQKVNKIIKYLDDTGVLMNNVLTQWNSIYDWILSEGITEATETVLNEMLASGTLGDLINNKLSGVVNAKEYGVVGDGVTPDSDNFKNMIDLLRLQVLAKNLDFVPEVKIPSGVYVIDKEIKLPPYIKFKSDGMVTFKITFNGSAFWITPYADDPIYTSLSIPDKSRNVWTRGTLFSGHFDFITTLDKATTGNNTVALEIGDRNIGSNKATPVSRYVVENVNAYGFNTAIKFNMVNNYLAVFRDCHWEMNNHALWFLTPTDGVQYNSGENMRFEECIIAGSVKEAVLIESPGTDLVFDKTSFDFNASPLINSKVSGTSVRLETCYVEKIVSSDGKQLLFQSAAQSLGDSWGRSSFYIHNLIAYLSSPKVMFDNLPNGTGNYIKVFLDIDGIELRYDSFDPYDISNRYLVDETKKFNLLRRRVTQVNTTVKNHVSKGANMLNNGDFELTPLNTVLSSTTLDADPYWKCTYHDNTTNPPQVIQDGVSGSKCLQYLIARPDNTLKIEYGQKLSCEPNETLEMSALIKLDKLSVRTNIVYRFEFYDANDVLISTQDYTDFPTDSPTIISVDGTNYRLPRTVGVVYAPKYTNKVKPIFIIGNVESTKVCIDEIYFTKVK